MGLTVRQIQQEDPFVNKSGRLGIAAGRFVMEAPRGLGAWPVVIPGENVAIYYRNTLIDQPTVIEDVGYLRAIVKQTKPESSYEIIVSPNKMEVTLVTRFRAGKIYRICDVPAAQKITVRAELVEEIAPEPISPQLVLKELESRGIVGEIRYDLIAQLCAALKDSAAVIVTGIPPRQPVDGRVELVCDLQPRLISAGDAERIDYRERRLINSVDVGEVLAVWHPPVPGMAGRNVYGDEVPVRPPKNQELLAGRGVKLLNNGRIAVAEIPGRPVYRSGVLSISQQVVVEQDVSLTTGNIRFKGDVLVLGNVNEGMEIEAGGIVDLKGNCYHAKIHASSHVRIGKKLIGGTVTAGIMEPGLTEAAELLSKLQKELQLLAAAGLQLKQQAVQGAPKLALRSDGYFLKLLLETRFTQIPKQFLQLGAYLQKLLENQEFDERSELAVAVCTRSKRFLGLGPLSISSIDELGETAALLGDLKRYLESSVDDQAQIAVGYCQNAYLEASGSISIRGPLIYSCTVISGADLLLDGECRCGSYYAKQSISAEVVGSGAMAATKLEVGEDGYIRAAVVYPGVEIKIGSAKTVIERKQYYQEYRLDPETGLVTNTGM